MTKTSQWPFSMALNELLAQILSSCAAILILLLVVLIFLDTAYHSLFTTPLPWSVALGKILVLTLYLAITLQGLSHTVIPPANVARAQALTLTGIFGIPFLFMLLSLFW